MKIMSRIIYTNIMKIRASLNAQRLPLQLIRFLKLSLLIGKHAVVSTPNVLAALNTSAELNDIIKYTQKKPSILAPSAGYIFAWKGYNEASRFGSRV
jgi:hypothetical protein